jgi:hypothetical protein
MDSALDSLLAGGAGAAALARGVGRLLGVLERKEVRTRFKSGAGLPARRRQLAEGCTRTRTCSR